MSVPRTNDTPYKVMAAVGYFGSAALAGFGLARGLYTPAGYPPYTGFCLVAVALTSYSLVKL